jgi:signal transduction histidine kinase/CheY-like chemotaxis protein/purine-cytosine permease-like protein
VIIRQRIVRERRQYNQWVATQTLEDYALRYTADRARRSAFRVGNTAFGPIAFLACEAIGGSITLSYGFQNAAWAIAAFCILMFLIGLPICYYAARDGVDIDLLTRGAGFGYIGSTITSLIYASFTFLLFAIEASIMSTAVVLLTGMPLWAAHLLSALVVIPIAVYGISLISRIQILTQPVWLLLQLAPLAYIVWKSPGELSDWMSFAGASGGSRVGPGIPALGAAFAVLLSLLPQIGEQADYLRFMPPASRSGRLAWWTAVVGAGPGWVFMGGLKLFAGSMLAVLLLRSGADRATALDPTQMYRFAFERLTQSPQLAIVVTGVFVVVCQVKINVTNAYAGSIAWSNFFSRVTHSHPGRVVWLVFNVLLALLLMEIGIFDAIQAILGIYANFAAGWIGALVADLVVNKPVGLSPSRIEFKRAYLYDVNPVGVGALALSIVVSSAAFAGVLGPVAEALSPLVALVTAFVAAPLIAWYTDGRYYLARAPTDLPDGGAELRCTVCENHFERRDMAQCPAYAGTICSLCCTLDARCRDQCKPRARATEQLADALARRLPARAVHGLSTRAGRFFGLFLLSNVLVGLLLLFIDRQSSASNPAEAEAIGTTMWIVYLSLLVLSGIAIWVIVLAQESRRVAEAESLRQTSMLMEEIDAHQKTDAALQKAKEVAESANLAKTRYIVGLSHEMRTPLNSIYGYAQLLERTPTLPSGNAVRVIRRSAEHLAGLIDGLLDISKIEGGILKLNRDLVNLPELLDQLVDMFRLQAASKDIEFRHDLQAWLPQHVYTDEKRLRQILINLLSNSVKYTEQGHAGIQVRYRNQVAEFIVHDSGIGIPAEELDRVFEPFERGRSAAVLAMPGTGLGLTITKLLTQVLGGEITVQSTPGVGTRFTVRLMLSEASCESVVRGPARTSGYEGRRRRVLIVDDNDEHQEVIRTILGEAGFEVSVAGDGEAALVMVCSDPPDVAILDLSLPDMRGWDLCARFRSIPMLSAVPIAILSANAHEFSPGGGDALHDAFILKPIQVSLLLETLGRLLRLRWRNTDATVAEATWLQGKPASSVSRRHVDDLYQLGRIGHVRGIHAKLQEIEEEDASSRSTVTMLRQILERFDMRRYMKVIEGMLENE